MANCALRMPKLIFKFLYKISYVTKRYVIIKNSLLLNTTFSMTRLKQQQQNAYQILYKNLLIKFLCT